MNTVIQYWSLQLHNSMQLEAGRGCSVLLKDTSAEQMFAFMGLTWTKKPIGWKHSTLLPAEEMWIAAFSRRRKIQLFSLGFSCSFKGSRVQHSAKLTFLSDTSVLFLIHEPAGGLMQMKVLPLALLEKDSFLLEGVRVTEISFWYLQTQNETQSVQSNC